MYARNVEHTLIAKRVIQLCRKFAYKVRVSVEYPLWDLTMINKSITHLNLTSGLDVATCEVANATSFYSVATKFSRLVANLASWVTFFFRKTYTNDNPLFFTKLSDS